MYAFIKSLPHAVDTQMIEYIVRDTVAMRNLFPTSATPTQSPKSMLDGETLDYGRYCKYHCGMVGNVAIPYTDATGAIKGDRMETVCTSWVMKVETRQCECKAGRLPAG